MLTIERNIEKNGIEAIFDAKPTEAVRETLKENGFKWHHKKQLWYAKESPERVALLESLANNPESVSETARRKPSKDNEANQFGVQVGDIFHASWGYEQTNNDFFQVVALVGKSSVRVREVNPPYTREAVSGMSKDRIYNFTRELLPPADRSLWIKDQEKGDIKRLKSYRQDGKAPQFTLASYADAHYCEPGEHKFYESWYY